LLHVSSDCSWHTRRNSPAAFTHVMNVENRKILSFEVMIKKTNSYQDGNHLSNSKSMEGVGLEKMLDELKPLIDNNLISDWNIDGDSNAKLQILGAGVKKITKDFGHVMKNIKKLLKSFSDDEKSRIQNFLWNQLKTVLDAPYLSESFKTEELKRRIRSVKSHFTTLRCGEDCYCFTTKLVFDTKEQNETFAKFYLPKMLWRKILLYLDDNSVKKLKLCASVFYRLANCCLKVNQKKLMLTNPRPKRKKRNNLIV